VDCIWDDWRDSFAGGGDFGGAEGRGGLEYFVNLWAR
jgi:hypothetical protein